MAKVKKSYSSDVDGSGEWRYEHDRDDWRVGISMRRQPEHAYEFKRGAWMVTYTKPVPKNQGFNGVEVENYYFNHRSPALRLARQLKHNLKTKW